MKFIPYESQKAERLYATYEKYYAQYEAKKGKMFSEKLGKYQYIWEYNMRRVEQQEAIASGAQTYRLNLAREIAADQQFFLNRKAIKGWYEISKEAGLQKKYGLKYFREAESMDRLNQDEVGKFLADVYKQLKAAHPEWDTKTLSSQISHTYFGS